MKILLQTEETPVVQKTKELCQTILDQPAYQEMRRQITAFLQDQASVQQYQRLCDQQDLLQAKQEQGEPLSDSDIEGFEREEQSFLSNPLASGFIDAQRQMQKIEKTVAQYLRKTFELGRLPAAEDMESGGGCGCGSGGCGCH